MVQRQGKEVVPDFVTSGAQADETNDAPHVRHRFPSEYAKGPFTCQKIMDRLSGKVFPHA